jgi:hypothetical protein
MFGDVFVGHGCGDSVVVGESEEGGRCLIY